MVKYKFNSVTLGKGFIALTATTLTIYLAVLLLGEYIPSYLKNFLLIYLLNVNVFAIIASTISMKTLSGIKLDLACSDNLESVEGLDTPIRIRFSSKRISHIIGINNVKLKSDRGIRVSRWSLNEEGFVELYLSGYPGTHKVHGFNIELSSLFSIYRIYLDVEFDNPINVKFIPIKHKPKFNIGAVFPHIQIFEGRSSRRKGVGSEVFSVREFMPFDDFKRIHWKASAKVGKLMVKEYEHRMYRNAVVLTSIHNGFFIGEPPPITFLTKMILDVVENLLSQGMKVAVGLITEKDVKASTIVDRARVHEINKLLSNIEWPIAIDNKYVSSNILLRWFSRKITENLCREPCVVFIVVDPLSNIDIDNILNTYKDLKMRNHLVKILLSTPSTIRFLYTDNVGFEDVETVMGEVDKLKKVLVSFKTNDVYLPTAYLRI
ncbi:MAG: DUF58 domain-containing protein [Ignisphaera sp.]